VRVVWLGGFGDEASYRTQQNRMGELNGRADIAAWRTLLEEPVDLLHVPTWPAPAKILVDPASFAEELRTIGRPVASYLAEILELWASEYGDPPERRKELWDLACVVAVAEPEVVTVEPLAVPTLDAAGAYDFTQTGREVQMVSDLDERRVLASLMVALARHPAGERPDAAKS
jgi:inosine-uridine nucleoside N-ribohydrolase